MPRRIPDVGGSRARLRAVSSSRRAGEWAPPAARYLLYHPCHTKRGRVGRGWPTQVRAGTLVPAIDVSDDDRHYTITVELPGGRKEDLQIEVQHDTLTIRGEKKSEREEKKEQRRYVERSYGTFSRSFSLPSDADAEHIDASFKDGVLTIRLPKTEAAKPRAIAVK
jgi:HSP20 family protein